MFRQAVEQANAERHRLENLVDMQQPQAVPQDAEEQIDLEDVD